MKLTETIIRGFDPVTVPTLYGDDATQGLYLKQYPSGKMTYVYRTRKGGAWRVVTLGDIGLSNARRAALKLAQEDIPDAMTMGDLLDRWYLLKIEPNYKTTRNIETYVGHVKDWFGNRQAATVTTRELVAKLQAYAKDAPIAANRCLSTLKLCFNWGVESGILNENPLAKTTSNAVGGKEKTRERFLTDDEIRHVFDLTTTHGPLLRALLLSGCRISELQAARIEHIDGDILHIPETKSSRPHWIFVTPLMREQFGDFNGYLFAERSATAVQSAIKRRSLGWTPHDLRRTFRSRLSALGVAPHIAEKCLNHKLEGILEVYDRHDYAAERIDATMKLTDEVTRLIDKNQKP